MKSLIKKIIALMFILLGCIFLLEVFTGDGSILIRITYLLGAVICDLIAAWLLGYIQKI